MAEIQYKPPVIYSTGKTEFQIDPKSGTPTPQATPIKSDVDALKNNLDWGKRAVEWANRYIRFADNRFEDKQLTWGLSHVCVLQMRSEVNGSPKGLDYLDDIRNRARIASRYGCGNCAEMSAVAFIWLYDWYWSVNKTKGGSLARLTVENGDHMFAILGYEPGKASKREQWGQTGVVVDPWNYTAYPLVEILQKRSSGEVYRAQIEFPALGPRPR